MKNKYPNIKSILAAVMMSVLLTVSCLDAAKYPVLDKAESLMENHPDSAFSLLKKVDKKKISGKKAAARYALLMSMALDKNFIDTTSFDVLQPAIDYYTENGTPDEKLRTFYYQGRIFYNRGEAEKALECYAKGLDNFDGMTDSLCLARAFVARGIASFKFYDIRSCVDNYLNAARIYNAKHIENLEFDCLANALSKTLILKDKAKADSILSEIDRFEYLDDMQNRWVQEFGLSYALKFKTDNDLRELLNNQDIISNHDSNHMLSLASAYNRLGDNDKAKEVLDNIVDCKIEYDTLRYLLIRTDVLEGLEEYKDALSSFREVCDRLDLINTYKFNEKVISIEDKHRLELKAETEARKKERFGWAFLCGTVLLTAGIFILILALRNTKAKKDLAMLKALAAEKQVEELEEERIRLQELLDKQDYLPEEVRDAIRTRVEMQNSLLASHITNNHKFEKPYESWIETLTEDRNKFMDSTRLAFKASHPNFIKHFEEQGLTDDEINYVCLYAIGLSGKEVGIYMNRPGHVNTSSAIRKKLGLDQHETNLGKYVRDLLKK